MCDNNQTEDMKGLEFKVSLWECTQYELTRRPEGWTDQNDLMEVIGGCFVTDFGDWVEISALYINARFRKLGIGTYLVGMIVRDYSQTHAVCLRVETEYLPDVPMSHEQLAAWYRRLGFEDGSPYHEGVGWMSYIRPLTVSGQDVSNLRHLRT